jgi:hypothetical protein
MTSTSRPLPPLSLSAPCWHRHHCCHGCRVAAAIATIAAIVNIAIAAATATAAAVSAATIAAAIANRFLINCCLPLRFLCFCHHCLPLPLPLLAADAIATVATAANRFPLLLPPQPLPLFLPPFLPLFSLLMFKIFLRPSNILNIFVAVPCSFRRNRCLCFYCCPLLALFPLPLFSVSDAMACPL